MPIQDWTDPATWDASYDIGVNDAPQVRLHYHRAVRYPAMQSRAQRLVAALGLTDASTIAVIGSAYGWLEEALLGLLPGLRIVSVDNGPLVQAQKSETETVSIRAAITAAGLDPDSGPGASILAQADDGNPRAWNRAASRPTEVLDEDLANNGSRNRVKGHISVSDIGWAITDDVLTTLSDNEIAVLADRVSRLSLSVAHIVTCKNDRFPQGHDAGYNWKTLAEWKAFGDGIGFNLHLWMNAGTGEVL
jgi:hypothetical protein